MSVIATVAEREAKQGADLADPEGFRVAALANQERLFRVAARMVDAATAEDLVQEAYTRAFAARGRYRGDATPFTWLCGVLLNVCRSELRRRRVRRFLRLGRTIEEGPELEPVDPAAGPALVAAQTEQVSALRAAIGTLPHAQRAAVVLVNLEGVSAAEAARVLGSTEAAVWQALSRARKTLRRALDDRA